MGQFQIKGKKMEKEVKEAPKAIPLRNGRELEENELLAEQNAIELSIRNFTRIKPVPGTLGYLFRDLIGGNASVYEFVKNILPDSNYIGARSGAKLGSKTDQLAKKVILIFNALDEHSKNRVDVFDHLCDKVGLARREFYGLAQKGMFDHFEAISQRVLMETKPEVIHNVRQFAREERNFRDRELAAKATGLTKDAPIIGNIDASTKINNNLTIESNFSSSMKEIERQIKDEEFIEGEVVNDIEPKQLNEGNTEFLNVEAIKNKEEELLSILRK